MPAPRDGSTVAAGLDVGRDSTLLLAVAIHAAQRALVADIGGATTELTAGRGGAIVDTASVPLGALALAEAHLHDDLPGAPAIAAVVAAVDATLANVRSLDAARKSAMPLVASGGTAT